MNKLLLSTALAAIVGVASLAPQAASAADGTITINGQITSATCTININGLGASPTITLPTVQTSDFTASGTAAGYTAVTIALSNCAAGSGTPAVTKVLPYFEQGLNTDLANGYLKNTGTATNVEVMLSNSASTASKVNLAAASGAQNAGTAALISGNPSFTYYASYISTAASVTAGTVSSTVQYSLNYQ
ncbi:fimbrial protein [Dyella sp. 20L07]|uniref:fimbrial protein n=1 Tax=Dyella sp. 20L07 TaxID=3384240 RepID=UPI003D2B183A